MTLAYGIIVRVHHCETFWLLEVHCHSKKREHLLISAISRLLDFK